MSIYGRLFTLEIFKADEVKGSADPEVWRIAAYEVFDWAQTISQGACRGIIMSVDGGSAVLLFDNEKDRAKVAAEYEAVLLWKEVDS